VATVRTETQEAVTFATDKNLTVIPPQMIYCLVSREGNVFHDYMPVLKSADLMDIFNKVPKENDAFYAGFKENLASNTLRLTFEASIEGIGVDPRNPPLAWEYWSREDSKWSPLRMELDTTGGLNRSGEVILHVPYTSDFVELDGKRACWVRCRIVKTRPRQPSYSASPKVKSVIADCIGGTVTASHAFRVDLEILGRSDGKPGQVFRTQNTPVLPRLEGETVEVEAESGAFEKWNEVTDFMSSGSGDKHFVCDSVSGEVQFGPSLRLPDGQERQLGSVPPKGSRIRFSSYRCGGGIQGNVGERTLTVLKSSIPYVSWVTNLDAASGSSDSETLEHAKLRAQRLLKVRNRAVTAEDFEYLALEASPEVGRAKIGRAHV
jgi:predicted phage baseplate assembly protein